MSFLSTVASSSVSGAPIEIQPQLVDNAAPVTSSQVITIKIGGVDYDFSPDHISSYPKLQDPGARFRLQFDPVYRIILGYPASSIPKSLLDEASEKEIFLSNCAFFDLKLTPDTILHLCSDKKQELEKVAAQIQRKGKKKDVVFWLKKKVQNFCEKELASFSDLYSDGMKPLDIVRHLELGGELIDRLVLHDWEIGKGSVTAFLDRFMKQFFL